MWAFGMQEVADASKEEEDKGGNRPILKTTLGLTAGLIGLYLTRRSRVVQEVVMKRQLHRWSWREGMKSKNMTSNEMRLRRNQKLNLEIDRSDELNFLTYAIRNSKPKIHFVTGPEGCGKSWLVHEALRSSDYVLKLDLNKAKVSYDEEGAHELSNLLITKAGYYEPKLSALLRDLGISSRGDPSDIALINKQELELGFFYLESVLGDIVRNKGTYPCIYIDEFHSLSEKALRSDHFFRFLQWCIHVTDTGLAQIIFCGNDTSLYQLDKIRESFRTRRIHYPINYPVLNPEMVKIVLQNADHRNTFEGNEESEKLLDAFGGQLKDIEHAIDFVDSGLSINATINTMIVETSHTVERLCFLPILEEISRAKTTSELRVAYKKYLRCWNMIIEFTKEKVILEDHLVFQVFGDHGHEISKYEKMGILRYCWPPLGESVTHEVTLTPMSPRYHKAFQKLGNRPGLNKVAMDTKRKLALMDLEEEERALKDRISVIRDVKSCLSEEGLSFNVEMAKTWRKLSQIWQKYTDLKDNNSI